MQCVSCRCGKAGNKVEVGPHQGLAPSCVKNRLTEEVREKQLSHIFICLSSCDLLAAAGVRNCKDVDVERKGMKVSYNKRLHLG